MCIDPAVVMVVVAALTFGGRTCPSLVLRIVELPGCDSYFMFIIYRLNYNFYVLCSCIFKLIIVSCEINF